jgi:hypothetical protein
MKLHDKRGTYIDIASVSRVCAPEIYSADNGEWRVLMYQGNVATMRTIYAIYEAAIYDYRRVASYLHTKAVIEENRLNDLVSDVHGSPVDDTLKAYTAWLEKSKDDYEVAVAVTPQEEKHSNIL